MLKSKNLLKFVVAALAVVMTMSIMTVTLITASATPAEEEYTLIINSPYRYVNWARAGQYRAAMHAHTSRSDGSGHLADMIKVFYNKGFDIVTIADHDILCDGDWTREYIDPDLVHYRLNSWTNELAENGMFRLPGAIDAATLRSINRGTAGRFENEDFQNPHYRSSYTGFRTQRNGMISSGSYSVELSQAMHTLAYFAPIIPLRPTTQEEKVRLVAEAGGLSVIAHPGRYSGGDNSRNPVAAETAATRSQTVDRKFAMFFDEDLNDSLLGIEIFNRLDGESFSDRIMWDRLLSETMEPTEANPNGRNIFGFANDDSHGFDQIGWNWNVMLMNNLDGDDFRSAMEQGAFYAVTRVARREGINTTITNELDHLAYGQDTPIVPNIHTMYKLDQTTPGINNITAGHGVIAIEGRDYDQIEWIADGEIIHVGSEFVLAEHEGEFNHYVRAQLRSQYGMAYTQPFGIRMGIEPPEVNFNFGGLSDEMFFLIIIVGSLVVAIAALVITIKVVKKRKV